jgi:hypothetical protein
MLEVNDRYQRSENIILRKLGEKQWALNTENGNEYILNAVSYDILNELFKPCSMEEIVTLVISIYDISEDIFLIDFKKWLLVALEKELIRKI